MKTILPFMLICLLISTTVNAHEPGTYDMTFDNWIKHHSNIQYRETKVNVMCMKQNGPNGPYKEMIIGNTLHFHKRLYKPMNQYDSELVNIGISGWLNTFGVKSGDAEFVYHSKPSLPRSQYTSPQIKNIIANISETGKFTYIYEVNSMRYQVGPFYIMGRSPEPSRSYHHSVIIGNPKVIQQCLE